MIITLCTVDQEKCVTDEVQLTQAVQCKSQNLNIIVQRFNTIMQLTY